METRLYTLEIVHPGYAYTYIDENESPGIKVVTNLSPADCNRRDESEGIVFFKSDKALYAWALRVRESMQRSSALATGEGLTQ